MDKDATFIFKYNLMDAWFEDYYELKIYDKDTDNVVIFDYNTDDEDVVNRVYTLSKNGIDAIKNLFTDNLLSLNGSDIEFPLVLDGCTNRFCIRGSRYNEFEAYNLWAWEGKDKPHPKADMVIKMFNNIKYILNAEKIDTTHFELDI